MNYQKDYYSILEVDNNASKEQMRASYRRLVKLHHPDLHPGNMFYAEKIKDINEAYELLSNDILRDDYDQYLRLIKEWQEKEAKRKVEETTLARNKRSYTRKYTRTEETKIYIKGTIIIKYQADPIEQATSGFVPELNLCITPVDVKVFIEHTDIFTTRQIPREYQYAYKESQIFKTNINQPVKCTIATHADDVENYELELRDIRIKDIRLHGITKYEDQHFGTLTGNIYAYHLKVDMFEEEEQVFECFGATGKIETKEEDDKKYFRKEFYNPDCTTSWGSWILVNKTAGKPTRASTIVASEPLGCAEYWWIPVSLLACIFFPKLLIIALILGGIWALLSFGDLLFSSAAALVSVLAIALIGLFIISGIRAFSNNGTSVRKGHSPLADTLTQTKRITPMKKDIVNDSSTNIPDTLLTHHIRWQNYDNDTFNITFRVSVEDVKSSLFLHNNMNASFSQTSLAPEYNMMLANDSNSLRYIHKAFDSLRIANNMDDLTFARSIVSCIQSIPYFLILNESCGEYTSDPLVQNYLNACTGDCCLGNMRFGVRPPAEFLSDLKGDCDTRALFIYSLLTHYNYNVALITSNYYHHAMVAMNADLNPADKLAMNIKNKNYFLWETTNTGFDIGEIPPSLQNLYYWNIALLNVKKL